MFTIKNLSQRLFTKNNVHFINNFRYVPKNNYYPKVIISNIPAIGLYAQCSTKCSENIEDHKYYKIALEQYNNKLKDEKMEEIKRKKNEINKIINEIEYEEFKQKHPIWSKILTIIITVIVFFIIVSIVSGILFLLGIINLIGHI